MKFDEILAEVGEFGPYQKRLYYLACLPAVMASIQALLPVFILGIPKYRCKIPGLANDTYAIQNEAHAKLINMTIPPPSAGEEGLYSHCTIYKSENNTWRDFTEITNTTPQMACTSWVYDTTWFYPTAITEFDMVCGHEIMRTHSNMVRFGGALTGSLVLGMTTDIIGRKKTLLTAIMLQICSGIGVAFAPNVITFVVFTYLSGISRIGEFMIAFVIAMELVGPSKRTFVGLVIEVFWCIGLIILSGLAYFIRDWRHLQLSVTAPAVLFFLYWWLLPESPRWLLSRGRLDEAEVIIKRIAKSNGVTMRKGLMRDITLDEGPHAKITAMFTSPVLLLRCVIIFFNWMALNAIYYGISLNVGNLSGNVYLNFVISSLVELSAYVTLIFIMDKTGRRKLYVASMVTGGIACLTTVFPLVYGTAAHTWVTVTLSMIGRFGSSAAFAIIYVFSAELFPTVIRQSGIGSGCIFGGLGGMIAPYISDMGILLGGHLASVLPMVVFGGITVFAGLTSLGLPETQNRKLPETIEDALQFGRTETVKQELRLFALKRQSDGKDRPRCEAEDGDKAGCHTEQKISLF
ncbi:organic cation transporter protein-like [Gigantopelta aegis]|uniref:organic cation transporter protein-like n=1 Tax=Gigantopelta aegis TaxID=1735272 RepID=UPI001B88DB3B|nr:organic cation transporter protein-like [Gigantopelta aegis]